MFFIQPTSDCLPPYDYQSVLNSLGASSCHLMASHSTMNPISSMQPTSRIKISTSTHLTRLPRFSEFPADNQPPRKGCDPPFLTQLLAFQPLTIVYVSCNVHTQARDVGWFIDHSSQTKEEKKGEYVLESLRGFDLFPQVRISCFSHVFFMSLR